MHRIFNFYSVVAFSYHDVTVRDIRGRKGAVLIFLILRENAKIVQL